MESRVWGHCCRWWVSHDPDIGHTYPHYTDNFEKYNIVLIFINLTYSNIKDTPRLHLLKHFNISNGLQSGPKFLDSIPDQRLYIFLKIENKTLKLKENSRKIKKIPF